MILSCLLVGYLDFSTIAMFRIQPVGPLQGALADSVVHNHVVKTFSSGSLARPWSERRTTEGDTQNAAKAVRKR